MIVSGFILSGLRTADEAISIFRVRMMGKPDPCNLSDAAHSAFRHLIAYVSAESV